MFDFSSRYISFAKRMRIERPWLWRLMCKLVEPLRYKGMSDEECEKILNQIYPDVHSTSMASNPPSTNEVDVQIIVPVYNVEKTLAECLESILSQQTKYSFKVTIVNDGSPDNSLAVAKRYESDSRVQIICQENKGLSGARNAALRQMCGKYVLFVDSDDRLTPGAIEALMSAAFDHPDMDIIVGGYNEIDLQGNKKKTIKTKISFPDEIPVGYPWGKVMKSKIWETLQWPEGYWFEDILISLSLYPFKKKGSISDIVYDYRINPEGIVSKSAGNLRIIETHYITRQLLIDNANKRLPDVFEIFFQRVIRLNKGRLETLHNEDIATAAFYQLCNLQDKYLSGMKVLYYKQLFTAIKNRNYILYSII